MFWYEEDIKQLEKKIASLKDEPYTLFYGSSSIKGWDHLENDFRICNGVNLGFGGSTLAACVWFFDRLFERSGLKPTSFVIYAGDNDLGDNRHPEEIFIFFQQIVQKIRDLYGDIPVFFISIKPSINRFHIIDRIRYTNKIISQEINIDHNNTFYINLYDEMLDDSGFPIRSYYQADGLHLNQAGYAIWKVAIMKYLKEYLPMESIR